MSPAVELHLESTRCRPGEALTGSVRLPEGGEVRALRVVLSFCETSMDYSEKQAVVQTALDAGSAQPGQRFAFTLEMPADAAPTLYSTHGELAWELEARADVRGRDASHSVTVAVLPAS